MMLQFRARARRFKWLPMAIAVASAAVLAGAGLTTTAAAAPITPTGIQVTASTDNTGLAGAVPTVLTTAGAPSDHPFTLAVTLTPAGASFKSDTVLGLTATGGGALTPSSVTMPGGANTASFTVSYSAVANGVTVTVSAGKSKGKTTTITPGTTNAFDVLKTLETFGSNDPALSTGLGVGNADCTQTSTEPECGTLVLSHGMASAAGALSLGACTAGLGCTKGSQVVQFIADLGTAYSANDPAVLIFRCDKSLCPGRSVASYTLKVSFASSGPLDLTSAPCVTKGVARDAAGNDFCTDYVQSHRDNSGDTLLVFLFTHDMRGAT